MLIVLIVVDRLLVDIKSFDTLELLNPSSESVVTSKPDAFWIDSLALFIAGLFDESTIFGLTDFTNSGMISLILFLLLSSEVKFFLKEKWL